MRKRTNVFTFRYADIQVAKIFETARDATTLCYCCRSKIALLQRAIYITAYRTNFLRVIN